MANLEAKNKMSALQLALVVASTAIGGQVILGVNKLVDCGGHMTWLALLLGGLLFFIITLIIIKLSNAYPDKTFVEYMPALWGRLLGNTIIYWLVILLLLQVATIMMGVSKAIVFYMFARTPPEFVALGLMTVCIYLALQDWGTFLRVQQFVFLISTPIFLLIWTASLFNFNPENLLPLWSKKDLPKLLKTVLESWNMYSGYEVILFLLPFTRRGKISIAKALGSAFGCMTFIFFVIVIITIGVLTIKGVTGSLYPTMTTMSSVELPGTFLERLETYLVVLWVPIVFDTLAIFLWISANVIAQKYTYKDHRPWVLFLAPLVYFLSNLLDSMKALDTAGKVATWLGLSFSLGVIPLSLLLLLWKMRGSTTCQK